MRHRAPGLFRRCLVGWQWPAVFQQTSLRCATMRRRNGAGSPAYAAASCSERCSAGFGGRPVQRDVDAFRAIAGEPPAEMGVDEFALAL